jgi:hypothetical protein
VTVAGKVASVPPAGGWRIGLVENTEKAPRNLAEKLGAVHSMMVTALIHKPQRAPVKDEQIAELKGKVDFVIAGVGDCGACSSSSLLDAVIPERASIPAVAIVTDAFNATAREMAELWGLPSIKGAPA